VCPSWICHRRFLRTPNIPEVSPLNLGKKCQNFSAKVKEGKFHQKRGKIKGEKPGFLKRMGGKLGERKRFQQAIFSSLLLKSPQSFWTKEWLIREKIRAKGE